MLKRDVEKTLKTGSISQLQLCLTRQRELAEDFARYIPDWPALAEQFEQDAERLKARLDEKLAEIT